jgi:8-oxo-dGTP pyrophosphatase MutT (NUDIX family)
MAGTGIPIILEQLRAALGRPLPGLPVQLRMAPQPRPGTERILDPALDCRHAAVLTLFYPCADNLCLVLTRRSDLVANHQGQISLPGGSIDAGETPEVTALREAWEELAIEPGQVQILGRLSPLYVAPSNFCIQPIAGYAPQRPAFRPAPHEVAEVIEEPLWHLLDAGTCASDIWQLRGQAVRVPFYRIGTHKVWGATAMVLCELVALLQAPAGDQPVIVGA